MLPFATPKPLTTLALTAGAAALSLLGAVPAGASAAGPPSQAAPATARSGSVDGQVVSSVPLRIRAAATTDSAVLGSYPPGAVVHLSCKVDGQNVDGNPRWYKLYDRTGWLAARYVVNLGAVPWC
ncbi:SH3 domain-containing protein [Streptomyces sp. NPDC020983]|uniref:SH3 domain-containing protein n=1 Tax=Streptomyces sp. NPDC020983 TaxID=3365106 RepID=UPI0037B7AFDE